MDACGCPAHGKALGYMWLGWQLPGSCHLVGRRLGQATAATAVQKKKNIIINCIIISFYGKSAKDTSKMCEIRRDATANHLLRTENLRRRLKNKYLKVFEDVS